PKTPTPTSASIRLERPSTRWSAGAAADDEDAGAPCGAGAERWAALVARGAVSVVRGHAARAAVEAVGRAADAVRAVRAGACALHVAAAAVVVVGLGVDAGPVAADVPARAAGPARLAIRRANRCARPVATP